MKRNLIAAAIAAALLSTSAWAQQAGMDDHHPDKQIAHSGPARGATGPAAGGGMMGGGTTGQGMMGGGTTGQGMMGGGTTGRGASGSMMGGGTTGQGMMGGGMMGHGMMGSAMMGRGMGAGALVDDLGLSDEQRSSVQRIHDEARLKQWDLMGRMMQEEIRLRDAFGGPGTDRAASEKAFKQMNAVREQMFVARLDAQEKLEAALTPEQRAKLRQRVRGGGWMMMMH